MFKLVVLFTLLAVAAAAPGLLHGAAVIGSAPVSVSSSSSSVVHAAAPVVAPVAHVAYAAAPVAYAAAPVAYAAAPVAYAAAPAVSTYSTHGIINTHGAVLAAPALRYTGHIW